MIDCSWKESFGVECPSCGAQRSFMALMQGHLTESILLFPALLPLMSVAVLTIIHLIRPLKNGPKWIVRLFVFSAGLMLASWIWKML